MAALVAGTFAFSLPFSFTFALTFAHHALHHVHHGTAGLTLPTLFLLLLGSLVDFLDDFRLGGNRLAARIRIREIIGCLVHDFLNFSQELDHFRYGLFDDKLLYIGGQLVLFVCELLGAPAMPVSDIGAITGFCKEHTCRQGKDCHGDEV